MLTDALHYATQGWHIFPLQTGGKAPMVAGGFKQATVDAAQITAWWTANPTANIGISLDDSGLCVVDVDTHGDINGFESLPLLGDLPDTAVARTPSGGAHYVFKNDGTPPPRKISLVRGIDLLSNGYIVAAPSVIDGKPYSWESQAVVSLPQSVRDMAAPKVHTVPSGIAPRSPPCQLMARAVRCGIPRSRRSWSLAVGRAGAGQWLHAIALRHLGTALVRIQSTLRAGMESRRDSRRA